MSSPIVTPEDVLETLMNDGTIDAIRLKIINQLKSNEELKNSTIAMVEQSKVLNTPGAEKQTKRELFDALRGELETPVLEKASKLVWEVILDNYGLGKEISETVEKVYCRLCGKEPTFFLPNADETQKDIKKEKGNEEEKPIESEDQRKKSESSSSSLRKRTFSDLNMDGMGDIANGNADSTGSDNSALRLSSDPK